jgi:hypothetical protein
VTLEFPVNETLDLIANVITPFFCFDLCSNSFWQDFCLGILGEDNQWRCDSTVTVDNTQIPIVFTGNTVNLNNTISILVVSILPSAETQETTMEENSDEMSTSVQWY